MPKLKRNTRLSKKSRDSARKRALRSHQQLSAVEDQHSTDDHQESAQGNNQLQEPAQENNQLQEPAQGNNHLQEPAQGNNQQQEPARGVSSREQPGSRSREQPGSSSREQPGASSRGDQLYNFISSFNYVQFICMLLCNHNWQPDKSFPIIVAITTSNNCMAGKYATMFATHTSTHMPSCSTLMSPRCCGCTSVGTLSWVHRRGYAVVGAPEQGSPPKAGFPACKQ